MRLRNQLRELLEEFPRMDWDYKKLSANPNIYLEDIERHSAWIFRKTNHNELTNPNLSWDCIRSKMLALKKRKYLDICPCDVDEDNIHSIIGSCAAYNFVYSIRRVIEHPACTLDIIEAHLGNKKIIDEISIHLASNPHITPDFIYRNPRINLNYSLLSRNLNIPLEFILKNLAEDWNFDELSIRPDVTWEIMKNTMTSGSTVRCPWSFSEFAIRNPNMSVSVIHDSLTNGPNPLIRGHSWASYYPGITPEILEMYPDNTWDYDVLIWSHKIPFSYIRAHLEKPWNLEGLNELEEGRNTIEDIVEDIQHPDGPLVKWDCTELFYLPHLFLSRHIHKYCEGKFVKGYEYGPLGLDQKIDYYYALSINPNITSTIIKKYPLRPWSFRELSKNIFNKDSQVIARLRIEGWNHGRNAEHFDRAVLREVMTLMLCNGRMDEIRLPYELINMIADCLIYTF